MGTQTINRPSFDGDCITTPTGGEIYLEPYEKLFLKIMLAPDHTDDSRVMKSIHKIDPNITFDEIISALQKKASRLGVRIESRVIPAITKTKLMRKVNKPAHTKVCDLSGGFLTVAATYTIKPETTVVKISYTEIRIA